MATLIEDSQLIGHWTYYQMIKDVPGSIVECGVFRGRSLLRWAHFRDIAGDGRNLIGFDTFDQFPKAHGSDIPMREQFCSHVGDKSSSPHEIQQMLEEGDCGQNLLLIKGDICETLPEFVKRHPDERIALLNMDCDLYEPTEAALENLYPMISPKGLLLCDDYNIFPGATDAINQYIWQHNLYLRRLRKFNGYYLEKE